MQQFLFTAPTPDRDSSVDGDVVFHEYGHGISNRLIGNGSTALSGTQSGAMGEGWSDYWAITINNDGAVGEYVVNNTTGIRRAAYTVPAAAVHNSLLTFAPVVAKCTTTAKFGPRLCGTCVRPSEKLPAICWC